jgi:transcriptional regulator with XRE-family HTH domain
MSIVSIAIEHYFYLMDINEQIKYIINRIKAIRIKNGVSQMDLSIRSNLSQSFIANLEKGKKQPSVLTLIRIADALKVNPQDFFPESVDLDPKEQTKEKIRKLLDLL